MKLFASICAVLLLCAGAFGQVSVIQSYAFNATEYFGTAGTVTGQFQLCNGSSSGACVTFQNLGATSAWSFNVPTTAGTSGQALLSAGGGTNNMTWGTLGVAAGGTGATTLTSNALLKGSGTSAVAASSITDNGTIIVSSEPTSFTGMKSQLTADMTPTASTSLVPTGLTLPSVANTNFSFHCDILYNQQTAAQADALGIEFNTTAPTRADAMGIVGTAATAVATTPSLVNLTSTTPTNIVTFTPSAATTVFSAQLGGTYQIGATAPTAIKIDVLTGAGADTITVKAGSYCIAY